jgi:hypothetical protein
VRTLRTVVVAGATLAVALVGSSARAAEGRWPFVRVPV